MNRHYKTLELDKILKLLADQTSIDDAKEMALSLEPQFELEKVKKLLKQTDDAVVLSGKYGTPSFGGAKNCANALRRAEAGGCLSTGELLQIAETLRIIRSVKEWHSKFASTETTLDGYFSGLVSNKFLEEKITTAIISEDEISDKASSTLADIRRKIRTASSKAREVLDKIIHSTQYLKYLQDAIVTQRDGRYVVPVRSECRGSVPGLVHDTSASGATVFIEPMGVVQANNDIKLLRSKEEDEIERILFELSANAGDFADAIIASYKNLAILNFVFAKANLAYNMRASMPIMNDRGIVDLKQARHPIIDKDKVVPVDIVLGKNFDTLVITGPNTGGKTVTLKTLGLLTLMAMCGLLVPCADNSELSVFRRVLVDIGDEQSIEQSLSTFSSHMTKIVKILELADDKSLVLIDELGAGTDPIEGAALAVSILEQLRKQGAKIAATTHYAELKSYALQTSGVINGSCEFDVQSLKPTYRLLIGIPGRSNAFAISKRLGISDEIIEHAQELVSNENVRFEDVVARLEQSRAKMEKEREEAEKIREEANRELEKAQKLKADIETLRQKELDDAKSRAVRITEQAKREAYQLLNDLEMLKKQQAKEKNAAEMARRARAVIKKDLNAIDTASDPIVSLGNDEDYVLPRPLKIGDTVIIADIGNEAIVVTLKDKKGLVTVQMGTMKTRVKEENLRLIEKKKSAEKKRTVATGRMESRMNMKAQTSVDLRGMTVEEGILELDRYIDHALRMGINEFTVIHGKGTGVLRSAVRDYLKKSKYVKTSRLGTFGEGEDGVSIVTLK